MKVSRYGKLTRTVVYQFARSHISLGLSLATVSARMDAVIIFCDYDDSYASEFFFCFHGKLLVMRLIYTPAVLQSTRLTNLRSYEVLYTNSATEISQIRLQSVSRVIVIETVKS
jgi:hypothetical protein